MSRRLIFFGPLVALVASVISAVAVVAGGTAASAAAFTDWRSVSVGSGHACGIRHDGRLYCWGNNETGELGDGTLAERATPRQITSASDWKSVSAGHNHTCAIRIGKLYCWGDNEGGEVGTGATTSYYVSPRQITAAADWTSVSADWDSTCAIRSSGKLYCWGYAVWTCMDDDPCLIFSRTPKQVTAATDWKSVSTGDWTNCAIRGTGKLYCWGYGPLGDGTDNDSQTPIRITSAADWRTVSVGMADECALRVGKMYCWGDTPRQFTSVTDWAFLDTGGFGEDYDSYCAIRVGRLYCWGDVADIEDWPTRISSSSDWKSASTGGDHACAIRDTGRLYCFGYQLLDTDGNGFYDYSGTPVQFGATTSSANQHGADDWNADSNEAGTVAAHPARPVTPDPSKPEARLPVRPG